MNVKIVIPLFVCLALSLNAPAARGQYISRTQAGSQQGLGGSAAGLGLAFATYLSGESLLMSTDDEDWTALSPNLSLRIGDRVWAQDGAKIEIRFPLGATAWVNYQSELDIVRMERGSRSETIQLALVSGEAAFDVKGFAGSGSIFQVDLPTASIRASRAARFRVNTLPDGTAQIGVISGSLVLETPEGLTDVSGGHLAEVLPDQRVLLDFLPASDEWDDWVRSRAAIYDRPAASRRYLPADLSAYAHEFDTSGRWVTDRTYGSVWVPAVERGWSPYSNGRWVWQANDYVWLSFDPWYAPFHYGRWSWGASIGWFWIVPKGRSYWSPGYVGWSVVGDEVSWVPLGRNEVYYGYGNYGPANVNVSVRNSFNVTNVYVNSRVNNGVVVVRKDNFLRGKIARERITPSRNPFELGGKGRPAIIGRPPVHEIKPIRETRQSRPEVEIKRVSLPPMRLEKESIAIRRRVVAPTKEKSVFRPGNKPAVLRAPAPAPAGRLKRIEAPGRPSSPAVQAREAQAPAPAGKTRFKRVVESPGEANVAPVRTIVPEDRQKQERGNRVEKDNKEEKDAAEERKKGSGQGRGNR